MSRQIELHDGDHIRMVINDDEMVRWASSQ